VQLSAVLEAGMSRAGQDHAASRLLASPYFPHTLPPPMIVPPSGSLLVDVLHCAGHYQTRETRHTPLDINPNEEDFQ